MPENNEEDIELLDITGCEDPCPLVLDSSQIITLYNDLNDAIKIELQDMYDCKKINGATYAEMWLKAAGGIIQSAISGVINFQTKETFWDRKLKEAQVAVADQDILNKMATESLTQRQILGFNDNARQKLYDAQMNAWALMFSSGLLYDKPDFITNEGAEKAQQAIIDGINNTDTAILGIWTQDVTATVPVSAVSTVTWGSVTEAGTYTLYVDDPQGSLVGYPKVVIANGTEPVTVPTPPDNTSVRYSVRVVAVHADGGSAKDTKTNFTMYGNIV